MTDTNKEREAFRKWAEQERVAGSVGDMEKGWLARASLAASAGSEPVAWPKDAAEVREFVGNHFRSLFYANATGMDPHENDVYELTAHDLLSAFRWWAELHPSPPEGAGWRPGQPITEAMHIAAVKVLRRASGLDGLPQRMLDAMIAAAPPASEAKGA